MKAKFFTFISIIVILTSCGQVKKDIASDQLLGSYMAKVSYVYMHSAQNIGWDDETKEVTGRINIFKNEGGEIFIETGDGNLKLAGITLAANGTTFNIPNQNVVNQSGEVKSFQGFQAAELDGLKFDGIYYNESNILNFGCETIVPFDYWGTLADVTVYCVYECTKIN